MMESHLQFAVHLSGKRRPDEDAIATTNNCVAVLDGVTLLHQDPYPVPSPAAEAAEQGAHAAIEYALAHVREPDFLTGCFAAANQTIQRLNIDLGITSETVDFLNVQYAAAVGAVACFEDPVLHYGQVNDCGVMLCGPDGSLIDELIVDKGDIAAYLEAVRATGRLHAGSREEHVFVRRYLINNPKVPFSEYVLTGEEVAINGVCTRKIVVQEPLKVLVYSDGFIPLLDSADFREKILRAVDGDEASIYAGQAMTEGSHTSEASLAVLSIE
jgi:hypothetical protein